MNINLGLYSNTLFVVTVFSICLNMFGLPLTLVLSKPLKIIKETTNTVNIVMDILGLAHLGADWMDIQTFARVESQFSGICAKAGPNSGYLCCGRSTVFPSKQLMFPAPKALQSPPTDPRIWVSHT